MSNGKVIALYIAHHAGEPMQSLPSVIAGAGQGLFGDRYFNGGGSWNRGHPGKRQVTLINSIFFPGSGFAFEDSRRNLIVEDVELMALIGKEFQVGQAVFRGQKYCDPCQRPSKLAGKRHSFQDAFHDRGGLVAEIIQSGPIFVSDAIVPPKRNY